MQWDEEVDLICVGSGISGCAAAIAAAEAGLRVILIEKSFKLGGTTTWSLGIVWVGNGHLARASGVADTAAETRAYLEYLGGGRNDPGVTQRFVDQAPAALRFFEETAQVPFYMVDKFRTIIIQPGKAQSRSAEAIRCAPLKHLRWAVGRSIWISLLTAMAG